MVDNPLPAERTGADPVTPEAVRNRANEVFGGIDFNTPPGTTQIGIGVITVGRITQDRGYFAEARVHGILVASIANEGDTEIYFNGEEPGGDRVTVLLVKTSEGERVDIHRKTMRHIGTGNVFEIDEQIKDPGERAKIARRVCVKV